MPNDEKKMSSSRNQRLSRYIKNLSGVVAYYPMNETSGGVAYDRKGSTNGTVTSVSMGQSGRIGTAYRFDGASSGVTFGFSLASPFSIGLLVKRNGTQDTNDRLLDYSDSGPENGMNISFPAAGSGTAPYFSIYNSTTQTATVSFGTIASDTWYLLVATFETNSAKVYLNGVFVAEDTSCAMSAPSAPFTLGKRATGTTNYFKGSVQHFFIANSVLTPTQITRLANIVGA